MPVRLKDIAKETGVSLSTVQQVLTGRADRFAATTREKVQRAADSLGYRPNLNARGMQSGRSMLVGVLFSGVNYAGATSFFEGVQEGLTEQGYAPVTFTHHSIEQQLDALKQCIARQVDGVILNAAVDHDCPGYIGELPQVLPADLPVIEVLGEFICQQPSIQIDFESIGQYCAQHLLAKGHRRIVMLTHEKYDRYRSAQAPFHTDWRFSRGFKAVLEQAGLLAEIITHPLPTDISTPGHVASSAHQMFAEWLAQQAGPMGICAANDPQGAAIVQAIREKLGPTQERVEVIYAGDPRQIIARPSWCSILANPFDQVGRCAADAILQAIAGRKMVDQFIAADSPGHDFHSPNKTAN